MKVELKITEKTVTHMYGTFQPAKTETRTVAELDGELTREATVGFLRALADSIEGPIDQQMVGD